MVKTKKTDTNTEISSLTLPTSEVETVDSKYVPEGFDTVEDYLQDLRETYELDIMADDDNRKAAIEDKKFVAGEQWDPRVLKEREGLPCLVINSLPQFTAQLVGDWRENKIAVKVLPAEDGDKDVADTRSDLIRAIETKSRGDRVTDNAFESMIQCGDGAFRVGVKYSGEDVFDQDIILDTIDDALSVVWDRLSIDPTGRDAKHCFVDDTIPTKEFTKNWKETKLASLSDRTRNDLMSSGWMDQGTVKVTEHWRIIERKRLLAMFEDGTIYPFEEDDVDKHDEYVAKHGKMVKSRLAPCRYAQMHLVTGFDILAGPYEWKLDRLPIIRMSGRIVSIGDRRVRYGLVRYMKDAARLRNFWRSIAAEQLGYAPKAQWLATESAVEGREELFRNAHKTRDPLLIVNDDAVIDQDIKRIDPPQLQMALLNEAQVNTQDMKDVTGIHDASLGIKSNETSGRAIQARQREGDVASLAYYDNGNSAVLEAGDVINQLIGQIYDGTRIIRTIGDDEATKIVNINDPMDPNSPNLAVGRYDVAISTGASYTTRRVEAAQAMMDAIQVFPEMMQYAGDLVVKAQDWPGAEEISERLLKTVPQQLLSDKEKQGMEDQPDFNALMQQQAQTGEQLQSATQELQKLQQENQNLKLNVANEAQKLIIDKFKAETDRLTAYAAIIKDGAEAELGRLENQADFDLQISGRDHEIGMQVRDHAKDLVTQLHTTAANQESEDKQIQASAEQAKVAAKAKSSAKTSTQSSK